MARDVMPRCDVLHVCDVMSRCDKSSNSRREVPRAAPGPGGRGEGAAAGAGAERAAREGAREDGGSRRNPAGSDLDAEPQVGADAGSAPPATGSRAGPPAPRPGPLAPCLPAVARAVPEHVGACTHPSARRLDPAPRQRQRPVSPRRGPPRSQSRAPSRAASHVLASACDT
eukprot:730026-Rhodomonas_salina.1